MVFVCSSSLFAFFASSFYSPHLRICHSFYHYGRLVYLLLVFCQLLSCYPFVAVLASGPRTLFSQVKLVYMVPGIAICSSSKYALLNLGFVIILPRNVKE